MPDQQPEQVPMPAEYGGPRSAELSLLNPVINSETQPPSAIENEDNSLTAEKLLEIMNNNGSRPGIHEMRVGVGDAEVHIPPRPRSTVPGIGGEAVVDSAPQEPVVVASVAAPTPVGQAKIEVEEGDTIGSVLLILALTTGLLIQVVIGLWAYFYFKGKYAKQ